MLDARACPARCTCRIPLQIVQTPEAVLITHEFNGSTRIVRMNWEEESPVDNTFFMGWSRGRWEGDTLVIDVTGLNEKNWFDRAGNFYSDAAHVVERITAVSPYHIWYEATVEDPKVFTRPWKISFPLYRRMEPRRSVDGVQVPAVRRRVRCTDGLRRNQPANPRLEVIR